MKAHEDRRQTRRRAFIGAGGIVLIGMVLAALLGVFLSIWAGLLLGLASLVAAWLYLSRPGGVPILVYHSVSPDASWLPWANNTSVRPETFRSHLETLKRDGWTVISTMDFVASRLADISLGNRTVILHFDDGYLDNLIFAAPILREFAMPATIFASLDFIEPGSAIRASPSNQGPDAWTGYMTAEELRLMDADPLFDIEAHGVDHARVPVSEKPVAELNDSNWRRHAPLAWAYDSENKAHWFEATTPPHPLRLGDTVPETDSALAGRWWRDGVSETDATYESRVSSVLALARQGLEEILGRKVNVFAWPYDRSCPISVGAAKAAGFAAVTGGRGENRPHEDPTVLSRVHVHDRAFGGGPIWLESLALRARVNSASGRLGWHLLVVLAARIRRRRFGRPGYGAVS
ncbi:polysaccharide deacetylase family protein [Marivita sp. S2033]|uniref:polysaccharide deacetylase family protein n=1 Tax=Marivita sp. S2033 TaxID=3373187 RepID=UPI0039822CC7